MIVIELKPGETIRIGDVAVKNLGNVRNRGVALGFDAPRDVRIDRAEVHALKEQGGKDDGPKAA